MDFIVEEGVEMGGMRHGVQFFFFAMSGDFRIFAA